MTQRYHYERTLGKKTRAGTDWPVEVKISRVKKGKWVAFKLCQGVGGKSHYFKTLHQAMAWAAMCEL